MEKSEILYNIYKKVLLANKMQVSQFIEDYNIKIKEDPNEVIRNLSLLNKEDQLTPVQVVDKMIGKLGDISNHDFIFLDPNCKRGSFLVVLHEKYGIPKERLFGVDREDNNVKLLHRLGYSNVIVGNILEENTILKLEELKENMGFKDKKFDIVIGNPPYGANKNGTNNNLHWLICEKCLDFILSSKGKLCFIMPNGLITDISKNDIREKLKKYNCVEAESLKDTNEYFGTSMRPTAIYLFDFDNKYQYTSKLDFVLSKNEIINNIFCNKGSWKKNRLKRVKKQEINKSPEILSEYLYSKFNFKYYLVVNHANGAMDGTFFSNIINDLDILTKDEVVNFFTNDTRQKSIIGSNNKEYLVGLQLAMKRPLLRYIVYLSQEGQLVNYDYIPDIDYSKITSDEDILNELGIDVKILDFINECKFESGKFIEERNREWKR